MKLIMLITAVSTAMSVNSCDKDQYKGSREGQVALGKCQTEELGNEKVSICYDKLITDSRCPKDVACVWAGVGVAQFTFTVNNDKHTLTLGTWKTGPYNKDTTIGRYKIELQNLAPYPGDKQPQPASATVKITRQ